MIDDANSLMSASSMYGDDDEEDNELDDDVVSSESEDDRMNISYVNDVSLPPHVTLLENGNDVHFEVHDDDFEHAESRSVKGLLN
jgi:hypothetical protein